MRPMVRDIGLCRPWLALENPDKEEAAGVVRCLWGKHDAGAVFRVTLTGWNWLLI
jgi:hypothetical protein